MKYPATLLFVLLIFATTNAGVIEKQCRFENHNVAKEGRFSLLSFENTRQFGEPGKATLPFASVILLLPPGEIAESVELIGSDLITIEGSFRLFPGQPPRPISAGLSGEFLEDKTFYRSRQAYPPGQAKNVTTHFMNGYGMAFVTFSPVVYIPSAGLVSYYSTVTVRVRTVPDKKGQDALKLLSSAPQVMEKARSMVLNPEAISAYPLQYRRTNTYQSLIVTKAQFSGEFDTLVSFYRKRGIQCKTVTIEHINIISTGQDLQEKIRNFIIQEYKDHAIQYVLLGGDVEIVPYRGFYCYVISTPNEEDYNIPSDLYYSALDGNWNTNGDNKWGEPTEADLLPEVAVGRLTFSDTAELHNMLHKTMSYQQNPVLGELESPLMAGEWLYGPPELTYGEDYMRLLIGYHTDNGYTTQGIPANQDIDSLYDSDETWTKADMIAKINQGVSFVHHCGHANDQTVMRLYTWDITNANFSQVNGISHNYPLVYTHGCICGAFDVADCIAERMIGIDNFAVAFIGNSRYGWFDQGTTDGPSEHLHREFVDALYRDSLYHLGDAHMRSKFETAPWVTLTPEFEPGATRWCFYDNNVLGDPMLAVWTYEPVPVAAIFPEMIPIGADSMIVTLDLQGNFPKGFTCTLIQGDSLFGRGITDQTGRAIVHINGEIEEGPANLFVTGYNCLLKQFSVTVADYWLGRNEDWNDPINWFTGSVPDQNTCIYIPKLPQGGHFPMFNSGPGRECKAIYLEQGSHMSISSGETITIYGN